MAKAKAIMVQGTMSNAGKSLIVAGLCRIFARDGYKVAPFKGQNMALNSAVTQDGLEMVRAQVMQAEAAGIDPDVRMNPILLKPTSDMGSQVIVLGEVLDTMKAADYYAYKANLKSSVQDAFDSLSQDFDIVVIEGAGSPAEINLKTDDLANMGMAKMAQAPVLLVGDIDPGGVFAQLYGTMELLDEDERAMVKGLVINKFRGDVEILRPGLAPLEEMCGVPVVGVVPYTKLDLDDEDSLATRLNQHSSEGVLDVAVIRIPHLSNFTDFNAIERHPMMALRYVDKAVELGRPDLVVLPGTKNTLDDLAWLKESGMARCIKALAAQKTPVIGICGGYQMLGETLRDPMHTESRIPEMAGLGLLNFDVCFNAEKRTVQAHGAIQCESGWLHDHNDLMLDGYEIHSGENSFGPGCVPFLYLNGRAEPDGVTNAQGNVLGSYLHGIFDTGAFWRAVVNHLRAEKGLDANTGDVLTMEQFRDREFDRMAAIVRQNLDMDAVYKIIRGEDVPCGRWADA